MEKFHSTFYGVGIYRHSVNGMWIARYNGLKRADTLQGLKQLIREARKFQHMR
jgi:hypothetical protein